MEPIKRIEKNGYTLTVVVDEHPEDPFEEWDFPESFGIDLSNTRKYKGGEFGEKAPVSVPDFINYMRTPKHGYGKNMREVFDNFNEEYEWEYVYMLRHGGTTVNTTGFSCRWDSWIAGIAFIKKEVMEKEQLQKDYLVSQVKLLDDTFQGNCFGYIITYKNFKGEDVAFSSCYGYWGDPEEAYRDGLGNLDSLPKAPKAVPELSKKVTDAVKSLVTYCSDSREWEDWEENGYSNNHIIHDAAVVLSELLGDDSLMEEITQTIPPIAPDYEPDHEE